MQQALVVCGPTASGKTKLALDLAQRFNGELVSADSRQVYKGLDIVTGKDVPKRTNIKIWGLDCVGPEEDWSVSQFLNMAKNALADIWSRNKLPIIVGGTGLYIKALQEPIDTVQVKPNIELRKELESFALPDLQKKLQEVVASKWESMNQSDQNNPRRLVRAIEVAMSPSLSYSKETPPLAHVHTLVIGLRMDRESLLQKITERVEKRLNSNYKHELELVEALGEDRPAVSALGYEVLTELKNGELSREEAKKKWTDSDFSYAKRQMVWFQKQASIQWFDINEGEMPIVQLVDDWYIKP